MANLIQPSKRISQPQQAADVDWNNGINAGLSFSYSAAVSSIDNVSNFPIAQANSPTKSVDKDGFNNTFVAANSQYLDCGTGQNVTFDSQDLTVLITYKLNSAIAVNTGISLFSRDGSSGGRSYTVDLYNLPSAGNSGLRLYVNGGGVVGTNQINETVFPVAGEKRTAILIWSPSTNTSQIWVNGALVSSSTATATIPSATTSARIGSRSYVGYEDYSNADVNKVYAWRRRLSVVEIKSLFSNPWQIFKPQQRRLWVVPASSGAVNLSGGASSAAAATGAITTSTPISGASISIASDTGAVSTSINLSGSSASVTTDSGALTVNLSLSGAALAQAIDSGALSVSQAVSGSASSQSTDTGSMGVSVSISGAAIAQAAAAGNLSSADNVSISGNANAQSSASGQAIVNVPLSGNVQAVASVSGGISTIIPINGIAASISNMTGALTIQGNLQLSGSALSQALAGGSLNISVPLSMEMLSSAAMTGLLIQPLSNALPWAAYTMSIKLKRDSYTMSTKLKRDSYTMRLQL